MGTSRILPLALLAATACTALAARPAAATERQWRLGADFGYAMAGLPQGTLSGFGGGPHLSYGLSDAFNLRVTTDLTAFDLPDPAAYTLIWSAAAGIEYVIDVLEWVPYVGLAAGPADVMVQDEPDEVRLGLTLPFGLGYQLLRELTVGFDGRYRLLLFGPADSGTIAQLALFGRAEYVWGW